jgi:mannosyl-oligosaccharide alpha-1,2-mannosidase
VDGIIRNLLYLSTKRNLLYVTEISGFGTVTGNMEHLSCYLPGVLALGAHLLDPDHAMPGADDQITPSRVRRRAPVPFNHKKDIKNTLDIHMRAAIGLGYTCWRMYDDTETGIGAEVIHFNAPVVPPGETPPLTKHIYESRRWAPRLKEWDRRGRAWPLIGTEDWPTAMPENPEYTTRNGHYLLRPEVSLYDRFDIYFCSFSVLRVF